ncbi:histidinol dehydrogenase [Caloramator quimbayensis]|uniref:Histidinol dehydrogenase n=1 Tax=Caloramator quimbayensis TaxID=1147123 RepID=A0A1T4X5S2_9CLOT|nr:histidinol dehydrogenase [Caloramator quimbayensis]SKA84932.1 histidinol dehydrogenase [Caloramator quimbayensis]
MKTIYVNETNYKEIIKNLNSRKEDFLSDIDYTVLKIINDIKEKGDKALLYYTKCFDKAELKELKVKDEEIKEALEIVDDKFISIIEEAKKNIYDYHLKTLQSSWMIFKNDGIMLGQKVTPIERIGIYVPGGKAAYPSTVLMNAVPAKIAGVKSIALASPPDENGKINPYILAAAKICDIDEIYKIGGAQAIAALSYGTESIEPVNKITGPGNIFVARAKALVYGKVDIDMIAGPSEICIIADDSANPKFIAADMLSQAEHDENAASILITTSTKIAAEVIENIKIQKENLSRRNIIEKSIENMCLILISDNLKTSFDICNEIAPEHLEIMVENPFEKLPLVKNAGAVFLGKYSPEPLGDYFAGPNHTLPTSGTAKFSSALNVESFMKKCSIIFYDENNLKKVQDKIAYFAEKEGLDGHANSIKVRFEDGKSN